MSSVQEVAYSFDEALKASTEYFNGDELAASVFVGKYALRNNDNQILESTPEAMHRRLAKEFARIEKKYPNPLSEEEIFSYLDAFRYIVPQGSPMSAIGNIYQIQSASNCFVAGTRVLTASGVKNIEDVLVGDEVVTHGGVFRKVVQTHKNKLAGRDIFDIKCFRTPLLSVTGNHKFLSISREQLDWGYKPDWNEVNYLRSGDYIAVPDHEHNGNQLPFDLSDIFDKEVVRGDQRYEFSYDEEKASFAIVYSCGDNKICKKQHAPVNRIWNVDSQFAYFLGLWLGDGCVFDEYAATGQRERKASTSAKVRGITFTFGSHEQDLIAFVTEYGESLFGIKADVNDNRHIDNTTQVVFHSTLIGMAFENLFGRKFDGKRLHKSIYKWSRTEVEALIQGVVDSDGTITAEGDLRVVMSNDSLIESLYHLSRSFGIPLGISRSGQSARLDFPKRSNFIARTKKFYSDDRIERAGIKEESSFGTIEIDGRKFVRIDSKVPHTAELPEYVYTLGVEEYHSYPVEGLVSLNCFVINAPQDSYGGILHTDQEQAQIMKRRGGVGFDISPIRPKGLLTNNAARTTDGIGVFMDRYSNTCREVAQGGRRGALMLTISCHHPEIRTFINIKRDKKRVTGANISIRLTDEFMNAVSKGEKVQLRWPVESKNPSIESWVDAKELWDEIISAAWESAEPGLLFWDTATTYTPSDIYADFGYRSIATNPCGEIILSAYDSCRLLVVNLYNMVINKFKADASFDFAKFREVVRVAQRLMDDIIDLEIELIDKIIAKIKTDPETKEVKQSELNLWKKIREACINGRRTGLGITGLGDALAALGIRYGSKESVKWTEQIYRELAVGSYRSSVEMAKERGAFPIFSHELEKGHPFLQRIWDADPKLYQEYLKYGRRNIANTTTAPVGSVSMLTQTTSGIECAYLLYYSRFKKINVNDHETRVDRVDEMGDRWTKYTVYHHAYKTWMEATGKTEIEDSPYYKATSNDVDWVASVDLQAAAQKWVCHAISKTCNLPNNATKELVSDVYMRAWKAGCKGFTVYRDGCRDGVLVGEEKKSKKQGIQKNDAPKRPESLRAAVHHVTVKGEQYFIFVGLLDDKEPYEVFAGKNGFIPKSIKSATVKKLKRGHYEATLDNGDVIPSIAEFVSDEQEALTRLVSTALRHGADIEFIVHQLEKTQGDMMGFSKALARALKKHIPDGKKVSGETCSVCGSGDLMRKEGCVTCASCGASRCG